MSRTSTIYAALAITFLLLGMTSQITMPLTKLILPTGNTNHGFTIEMVCNAVALLFCLLALIYSIGYIPLSQTMTQWHMGMTITSVCILTIGLAAFLHVAQRNSPTTLTGMGTVLVSLAGISIPVFVFAQAWFGIDLVRALLKMRT